MMKRAGRVHGLRGVLTLALLTAGLAVIAVRRQVIESSWQPLRLSALVERLLEADTPEVPDIVEQRCGITAAGSILR